MSVSMHPSYFILRLPIKSGSPEIKVVDYEISKLLLDLFAVPAFGHDAIHSLLPYSGSLNVEMITVFDEDDQSMRDLLQYLLHPQHFPICLENYKNLYRLAQKFQVLSLLAQLLEFMNKSPEVAAIFLYACEMKLQSATAILEDRIVQQFPSFIMNHTREQLSVVDSETMRRLIYKVLQVSQPGVPILPSARHVQALRLLYSYALGKELYVDMLNV